jgi:hypothetical protein
MQKKKSVVETDLSHCEAKKLLFSKIWTSLIYHFECNCAFTQQVFAPIPHKMLLGSSCSLFLHK